MESEKRLTIKELYELEKTLPTEAQMQEQLEPFADQLFLMLRYKEGSAEGSTGLGLLGDNGERVHSLGTFSTFEQEIITGNFKGEFREECLNPYLDVNIRILSLSGINYLWHSLSNYLGPSGTTEAKLEEKIKIATTEDGIMLWNGRLPFRFLTSFPTKWGYTITDNENSTLDYGGCPHNTDSQLLIIGNEAIKDFFEIKDAKEITDTRSLYSEVLKARDLKTSLIKALLWKWNPERGYGYRGLEDEMTSSLSQLGDQLEKKVYPFLIKKVFERYDIGKIRGDNYRQEDLVSKL